jgi:hypothetical protein
LRDRRTLLAFDKALEPSDPRTRLSGGCANQNRRVVFILKANLLELN